MLRTYAWQGGAGTWSDGKLVTRIGRNSGSVLAVRHSLLLLSLFFFFCMCVMRLSRYKFSYYNSVLEP